MRRGQGMPINIIVVVAIALLVLIVLAVVFTGRVQLFGKGLGSCNGFCRSSSVQCGPGASAVPTKNCNDGTSPVIEGDGYCCIPT